jgi:hypothetical protein
MQFLRSLFSSTPATLRRYAQVHDITIKVDDRILGSMERNGIIPFSPYLHPYMKHTLTCQKKYTVFSKPLALHSSRPLTGFMRTGYCEVPAQDKGNHSIAGKSPLPLALPRLKSLAPTHPQA